MSRWRRFWAAVGGVLWDVLTDPWTWVMWLLWEDR